MVASNIFEGILDINPDNVQPLRRFAIGRTYFLQRLRTILFTRAQEANRIDLAVTYNNILVDSGGFIYALSSRSSGKPFKESITKAATF